MIRRESSINLHRQVLCARGMSFHDHWLFLIHECRETSALAAVTYPCDGLQGMPESAGEDLDGTPCPRA